MNYDLPGNSTELIVSLITLSICFYFRKWFFKDKLPINRKCISQHDYPKFVINEPRGRMLCQALSFQLLFPFDHSTQNSSSTRVEFLLRAINQHFGFIRCVDEMFFFSLFLLLNVVLVVCWIGGCLSTLHYYRWLILLWQKKDFGCRDSLLFP